MRARVCIHKCTCDQIKDSKDLFAVYNMTKRRIRVLTECFVVLSLCHNDIHLFSMYPVVVDFFISFFN